MSRKQNSGTKIFQRIGNKSSKLHRSASLKINLCATPVRRLDRVSPHQVEWEIEIQRAQRKTPTGVAGVLDEVSAFRLDSASQGYFVLLPCRQTVMLFVVLFSLLSLTVLALSAVATTVLGPCFGLS